MKSCSHCRQPVPGPVPRTVELHIDDSANSAVLQVLLLDSNLLTELPAGVGQLSRLERLSVAHNSLTALPASLGQLQKLQVSRLQLQA